MITPLMILQVVLISRYVVVRADDRATECAWDGVSCKDQDPNLKEILVDLGKAANETFLAYHPPHVSTFYSDSSGSANDLHTASPSKGQIAKFINLSPNPVKVYWTFRKEEVYIAVLDPFGSTSTATYVHHRFVLLNEGSQIHEWRIVPGQALYAYDPIETGALHPDDLKPDQIELYYLQKDNLKFAKQYKAATGINYLSLYPRRPPPTNPMWPADYFGEEHSVSSHETHFVELPTPENLGSINPSANYDPSMQPYRTKDAETLKMSLKVLSCSPRIFEVQHFLSNVEIDHLMQIATGMTLHQSSTRAGQGTDARHDASRTSRNAWIERGASPVVDAIYRRAADLLRVDQSYLLHGKQEMHGRQVGVHRAQTTADRLQLVHYGVGDEYMPHHDFAILSNEHGQPMRFATVLLYLNDDMTGGETSFPRWLHDDAKDGTSTAELTVTPEVGKAVLFYSLLPDGNMDERSLHASKPVTEGEKWLVNLWIWDPFLRVF